jgi:hypothetical protein
VGGTPWSRPPSRIKVRRRLVPPRRHVSSSKKSLVALSRPTRTDLIMSAITHHAPPPEPTPALAETDIDLTAAFKIVGNDDERGRWLQAMLNSEGMSPGSSSRAHARAFRFAEALMRAGYQVTEAPLGPRGGRRFTLDGYDGERAGMIYRLQRDRSCAFTHSREVCACFDDLEDDQLKLVTTLRRKLHRTYGKIYSTNDIADLIRQHDERELRTAISLYLETNGLHHAGGPKLEDYLDLLQRHEAETLLTAVRISSQSGGTADATGTFVNLVSAVEAAREPQFPPARHTAA